MNQLDNINRVKNENIAFIADRVFKSYDEIDFKEETLEMIPDEYFDQVFDCLSSISKSVIHYNTLQSFIDNISKHKNDIVFTIYGGKSSRNRMALVPAICEAYKIRFVGADVYSRIICQDKRISKEYCKKFGITTARYLLMDQFTDIHKIKSLEFPLVIKPNMEGSSIGIYEESLVESYEDALNLAKDILDRFREGILIEQFMPGKEVCVCISGNISEVKLMEAVEVYLPEDQAYFNANLYTSYIKHTSEVKHRIVTEGFTQDILQKLSKVFLSLGKMDYLRIDGKLNNDKFSLIELTPDPHLSSASSFAEAFIKNGIGYKEMIGAFICNALDYYQNPYSNK